MTDQTHPADDAAPRKPRLALMGEFSAGKSTLTNLLLSGTPLPVKVTATRLPPVWISWGEPGALREDLQGKVFPVDAANLESVPLEETRLIRLTLEEDILQFCDLIDMPGISDPNMASEVWERVIGEADHIIWCSHATQAWRQSEAAVWDCVPEDLHDKSLLLLTRFDKIVSQSDRDRVLARVRRETRGLFADFFPVSLTEAMQAGDDRAKWDSSGAGAFVERLVDLLVNPSAPGAGTYEPGGTRLPETAHPAPDEGHVLGVPDAVTTTVTPKRVRAAGRDGDVDARPGPRPVQDQRAGVL